MYLAMSIASSGHMCVIYLSIKKFIASVTYLSILNIKLELVYMKAFIFMISKTVLVSATLHLCNIKF